MKVYFLYNGTTTYELRLYV